MKTISWILVVGLCAIGWWTLGGVISRQYQRAEEWVYGARVRLGMVTDLWRRVNDLERNAIHYGDAATIRVVKGDTVTFGRWVEPVAKEEGAK
jgi:hypothetical protein